MTLEAADDWHLSDAGDPPGAPLVSWDPGHCSSSPSWVTVYCPEYWQYHNYSISSQINFRDIQYHFLWFVWWFIEIHLLSQDYRVLIYVERESQDQDNLRLLSALWNFLINKNLCSSKLRSRRKEASQVFPRIQELWHHCCLWEGRRGGNWHKIWTGNVHCTL